MIYLISHINASVDEFSTWVVFSSTSFCIISCKVLNLIGSVEYFALSFTIFPITFSFTCEKAIEPKLSNMENASDE